MSAHPEQLITKSCTPCRGGIPPLNAEEAETHRQQTPEWVLLDDSHRIERSFKFDSFADAFAFVQRVAELAETEGHHPDITFGWGYATVSLQTHKINGLHENDFILAAKIDQALTAKH
ncbi:4a-hydroxytetrahydrobiopterin dehydratase [Methylobacterium sp. P31]